MEFLPWVRTYNHIEDFHNTLYKIYADKYIAAFPVTYYLFDKENSVFDKSIYVGTYDLNNIGTLSGIKFKKILFFPVYMLQPMNQLTPQSDENSIGITYNENMITSVVFPSIYGIEPNEQDCLDLGYGTQTKFKGNTLYSISSIVLSHQTDKYKIYQLNLKMINRTYEIDNQISDFYMFFEPLKKIIPLNNSIFLNDIILKNKEIEKNLNLSKSGYYLLSL